MGYAARQTIFEQLNLFDFERIEFGKFGVFEFFAEFVNVGKVPGSQVVFLHDGAKDVGHVLDEFLLFLFLAHDRGHLRFEVANDVGQSFDFAYAFDQFVDFAYGRLTREDG